MNLNKLLALVPEPNADPIEVIVHHMALGRGCLVIDPVCDNGKAPEDGSISFKPDSGGDPHVLASIDPLGCCDRCFDISPNMSNHEFHHELSCLIMGASKWAQA